MSSTPTSPTSPAARQAPHLRLNSSQQDLLSMDTNELGYNAQTGQIDGQSGARPLVPRVPSSQRPGTAPSMLRQNSSNAIYQPGTPAAESSDHLLPPSRSRPTRRFRDDPSPLRSPSETASRRTSWSTEGSRDSRLGPFASPFDDSRAPSRAGSDDEGVNTQTVSEKYNILPSAGLLLFPEDVEKDDWLHNPDPNDKDKLTMKDLFSKRGLMNVGGLAFITLGILVLFIVYPILTFVQRAIHPAGNSCSKDPMCISDKMPLLNNVRHSLIDPHTPKSAHSRKAHNGASQTLVFSDEFNDDGRTFYDGDDAFFQAMDLWYGVTEDLEWYDPDAISTGNGTLNILFSAFENHNLDYRSGMLQSWNKMCFKGGYVEASISLPGNGETSGFWPGFWTMGNLGRPGYAASTDGMWPYSYHDECDAGITANQSDPDGLSALPGMRLPACSCVGEDHPTPGKSRSAPEIDALEASVSMFGSGGYVGSVSQSCQIAPFDIFWRPDADYMELYNPQITSINAYTGGVYQQAMSALSWLNNDWYNGNKYQTYAFEYEPGTDGYITWYIGQEATWTIDARAIGPNGNIGQRTIPQEPMAIVANLGMSPSFSPINATNLPPLLPATMRLDYIRVYQDEDNTIVTCDPPGYATTDYIARHKELYQNPNITLLSQSDFKWPKNSYVDGCQAEAS
ncbi:MAG: hypothetical protein M1820_008146 [Bogoriella megaspora]|nr:MAG: hypothetical protein M1820_008146 [Bogoriella megaspora]